MTITVGVHVSLRSVVADVVVAVVVVVVVAAAVVVVALAIAAPVAIVVVVLALAVAVVVAAVAAVVRGRCHGRCRPYHTPVRLSPEGQIRRRAVPSELQALCPDRRAVRLAASQHAETKQLSEPVPHARGIARRLLQIGIGRDGLTDSRLAVACLLACMSFLLVIL